MNKFQEKYRVIFVLGPPGSGKNTQCDKIVSKYNLIHFSCGDLLREAALKDDDEGRTINQIMAEGKIVPVKITCSLAKKEMEKHGKYNPFLIDGFPRNKSNLEGWLEEFGDECIILAVLFLECQEQICSDRINIRKQYSGRIDDNVESLKKRFYTFQEETVPNIEILSKITSVIRINADRNRQEIFNDICNEFDKIFLPLE